MIKIAALDGDLFEVSVSTSQTTKHRVRVTDAVHADLTNRAISKIDLIERSFEFLLEREPNTSILSVFNIETINRYFPEYRLFIQEISVRPNQWRKEVQDIYNVSQSTLNDWEAEAKYKRRIKGKKITLEKLTYAGNFYKMIIGEMKNSPLILIDNDGKKYEVKDPIRLRKHIFLEHSTGTSIHEEEGHYFTVDDDFRKLILIKNTGWSLTKTQRLKNFDQSAYFYFY